MATGRKVILYIATSLDGYIAKPNFTQLLQNIDKQRKYQRRKINLDIISILIIFAHTI
jgi:hypothetical protein